MANLLVSCELAFADELGITRPNLAMDIVHHPNNQSIEDKEIEPSWTLDDG